MQADRSGSGEISVDRVSMRDGRVDVLETGGRCQKHRHHRHGPSRRFGGEAEEIFQSPLPAGVTSVEKSINPADKGPRIFLHAWSGKAKTVNDGVMVVHVVITDTKGQP